MESEVYACFFEAEERHWWFRARRRILEASLAERYPRRNLAITDVGCGTGGMMPLLSRFGRVTGVDEAPEAREYCARRGFSGILTLSEWEARPGAYDLISAFDVVEHVEDDVGFLTRLRDRLAPEGRLLVTVPAYSFLWSPFDEMNHHVRRYTEGRLRRSLERAGFEVERSTHFNCILLPALVAARLGDRLWPRPIVTERDRRDALARWFKVGPLNALLEAVFASERHWLRRADLPAGSSILAWGRTSS